MRLPIVLLLLVSAMLAGCSSAPSAPSDDGSGLQVTDTTGGIRGIVVDSSVVPVEGATVTVSGGASVTTGAGGLFNFTGLAPGDYFLSVSKLGYLPVQQSATVVAGVADPPVVKVLLERLAAAEPYVDFYKLDGFYECGFGAPGITDSCDFGWRTAYDGVNETSGSPPPIIPRSPTRFANTQYIDVGTDTFTIIQEAFWDDETVPEMKVSVDETPIDNACDCSDSYFEVTQPSPTFGRLDMYDEKTGETDEPAGARVASRGFLPFGGPTYAVNFQFTVITTLFHNIPAPEGWTFETKDQYDLR